MALIKIYSQENAQEEVDRLREMGWLDQDLFNAANQAAVMAGYGMLFTAFHMNEGI